MSTNLKPLKEEKPVRTGYNPKDDEKKVYDQYLRRKNELLDSRRNVYGNDIDELMRRLDRQYFNRDADIPASELDPKQKPVAINNAFGKVQAALGILIDRNPEIKLEESNQKYSANRELMKALAKSSWKNTNSLGQLKLSIFNSAKRGWFVGRTFHRSLKHQAKFLESVDEKGNKRYETKEISKVDDIAYMNLNNYNVWLDEQTRPDDFYSTRDWMWREVWYIDDLRAMFPEKEYPNMKFVSAGGDTRETINGVSDKTNGTSITSNEAQETKKGMTEVYFYENQYDDWFIIEINGVMVVWEPLPQNSKRLSCVYGYWNLRGAETIYGIGIVEQMERDDQLADRIMNMTMRQLLMTISPPGFYTGTEDPEDETLKYAPGTLKRTLDPKNISWLQIPEGNKDGLEWLNWLENKQDARTGITKSLEGDTSTSGSTTAFETGVNREAGLKRLRLPLKSIQYALDWEFRNRIDLIKQVYTDFKVNHLADEEDILNYLEEVKADPDFFFIENEGQVGKEKFYKKEVREFQLNLEQDEKGNFIETTEDKKFFKIKPEYLNFEGDVIVDANSILIQSEELEKADTLRMANILVPLLQQPPELIGRTAKQLLVAFNKDARKWLPDDFINATNAKGKIGPSFQESRKLEEEKKATELAAQKAKTVVPEAELEANKSPTVGLGQRFSAAFNAFKSPEQL